jgi:hypothetical protein
VHLFPNEGKGIFKMISQIVLVQHQINLIDWSEKIDQYQG